MDYVLDPELAAVVAALPKMDLSDLASARATEQLLINHLPRYELRNLLSIQDIVIQIGRCPRRSWLVSMRRPSAAALCPR
jgi:hypothetical protein